MEGRGSHSTIFSTREEVPPILLIFEEKLMGDWVSQSSRPQAPGRGLEGGRRSGLTPSGSFSRKEQEGRFLEPGKEEPGGVGGVEVVQEERWEEMRGTLCPGGVTFFKKQFPRY